MLEANLITGLMFGFEYVDVAESDATHVVLDLGIIRLVFTFFRD